MKKREEKKQALITLSTSTLFAVCIKRVKGNGTRKTNKNLCLVIFVNSQEPDQGQPCLHKKFRLSFKQAAKTLSELPTINEAVLCITTTYVLNENNNKMSKFSTKICCFYSFKNHCLLHRRVC